EAMQARYHLHLVTPFLFLAASALPELLKWPRPAILLGAAYLAASPLIHLGFERDARFTEIQEFEFLRRESRSIPDGCTMIEFSPVMMLSDPPILFASRLERMAQNLDHGSRGMAFKVVNAGVLRGDAADPNLHETLSPQVLELMNEPPACL